MKLSDRLRENIEERFDFWSIDEGEEPLSAIISELLSAVDALEYADKILGNVITCLKEPPCPNGGWSDGWNSSTPCEHSGCKIKRALERLEKLVEK